MVSSVSPTQGGAIPQAVGVCDSDASKYWVPVLLAYKGLYLIVGLWLAATTYRVKIKQLRDSKLIVACVISISLVSMVLTLITFLLPTSTNERYGVIGSFILVLLTSVLFLLFVTRVSVLCVDSVRCSLVLLSPDPPISIAINEMITSTWTVHRDLNSVEFGMAWSDWSVGLNIVLMLFAHMSWLNI